NAPTASPRDARTAYAPAAPEATVRRIGNVPSPWTARTESAKADLPAIASRARHSARSSGGRPSRPAKSGSRPASAAASITSLPMATSSPRSACEAFGSIRSLPNDASLAASSRWPSSKNGRSSIGSVESRGSFCLEGVVELTEVPRLHTQSLAFSLGLDRRGEVEIELSVEELLGHTKGERRLLCQPTGEGARLCHQLTGRHDLRQQPQPERVPRRDRLSEHQDLGGPRQADYARQQVRGAHVRSRESDSGEEKCKARRLGCDPEIARQRDDGARA